MVSYSIMRENKIQLNVKDNYRIVALSDIHGHLEVFDRLLKRLHLSPEDHLVIIGDFINKGPDSLKMIHRMMELSSRPNTTILKGNHEYFICFYLFGKGKNPNSPHNEGAFLSFLKSESFNTLVHDICKAENFDLQNCDSFHEIEALVMGKYKAEFDFINELPALLCMDDFIFVHGGYQKDIDPTTEEGKLLKFDDFNTLSDINDKTVIVGHWPTANLRSDINTNIPYFNHTKNIISIDGGIGVKSSGELNALIVEKKDGKQSIDYIQENHFPLMQVIESFDFKTEDKIFVNYPHFDLEFIEKGRVMTRCRHIKSGKELSIFNSLLDYEDGNPKVITTYINHFLNLPVGEEVEMVAVYDDCILVKHNNEFGWLHRFQLDV